jgi:hypothetical protein
VPELSVSIPKLWHCFFITTGCGAAAVPAVVKTLKDVVLLVLLVGSLLRVLRVYVRGW